MTLAGAPLGALLRLCGSVKNTNISMACRIGVGSVSGGAFEISKRDWLAILWRYGLAVL